MTRDDIYDHLAQVYLGKRKETDQKKKKQFNAWLVINIIITAIIFGSAFYGLTAFLTQRGSSLQDNLIFSLHHGPLSLEYNFKDSFHPDETFVLSIPEMDATKYKSLQFSIRAKEEGTPGIVKIVLHNRKNETAYFYAKGVGLTWKEFRVPLKEFHQITDWTDMTDLSFVVESWNVDDQKGLVLIDNIYLSTNGVIQ